MHRKEARQNFITGSHGTVLNLPKHLNYAIDHKQVAYISSVHVARVCGCRWL